MKIKGLLSAALALGIAISACGCTSGTKKPKSVTEEGSHIEVEDGIHRFSVSDTNKKIVENGTTDYKIVKPVGATSFVERAVTEFMTVFKDATGISLTVITDAGLTFSENDKYFVFGDVSFADKAEHGFDMSEVNSSGFVIKTKGNSIFVLGASSAGVLNGSLELLTQLFDYGFYAEDCIVYQKGVKELNLKDFAICDASDIEYSMASWQGAGYANPTLSHKYRQYTDSEMINPIAGCHDVFRLLDPVVYAGEHPTWYMGGLTPSNGQLCYTAHGDPEEYKKMVSTMVENIKASLLEYPEQNIFSITQNDVAIWCSCESCQPIIEKYGGETATQILFVKEVTSILQKWLDEEQGGRRVTFPIFAYHKTESCPANANEDLKFNDNMAVWFAPVSCSYSVGITDPVNISVYKNFEKWTKIADKIYLWYYDLNAAHYLIPNNTFHSKPDWYRAAKKFNAQYVFNQGMYNAGNLTAFNKLKAWLNAKLSWDVNADYQALITEYFENYYGPASSAMYKLFAEVETICMANEQSMAGVYAALKEAKYWKRPALISWMNYIEEAYNALEPLKTVSPELYKVYEEHITLESVFVKYLLVELHSASFRENEINALKTELADNLERYGFARISEHDEGLSQYLADLRKNA